jgi:hypothetical protein
MAGIVAVIEIMMIFVEAIAEATVVVFAAMVIVIFIVVSVSFGAVIVGNLLDE